MIQETMNPFDVNLDPDKLYNIGTGLAAVNSAQNVLLNAFKNGENVRKKFIEECSQDSTVSETYQKANNYFICCRNWETENNCIRGKSFTSMLNERFVWEHFIHIVTKEG